MATQRNNGRSSNRQINQEPWRGRDELRPHYETQREERERLSTRDRDSDLWDRDRDRDDEYRMRTAYGHEIDSGRVVQGERRFDERGPEHFGFERSERVGYGSPGYGYGGMGSAGSATGYSQGMYGRGYAAATERGTWHRGREYPRTEVPTWNEGLGGHRGKGPRNFMQSDERIAERVCEILTDDDRIDASEIDVNVKDGEVTLSGAVDDRRAKRLAEDIIEELPGVRDVQNRLRVRQGLFEKSGIETAIDRLNSFLRGELAAVETYRIALDKLDKGSQARGELESCKRSHEERVNVLRNEIARLGGRPATSSGPWGVFAKTIEGGARVLGDKAAIAALEEGEDHGLRDYRDDIDKLDPEFRPLVRSRLLPAQEDTHSRMSTLKHRLS